MKKSCHGLGKRPRREALTYEHLHSRYTRYLELLLVFEHDSLQQ